MEDTRFLKSMNESLEANKAPLERKIKQAQRERIESQRMIQKYLPALEEKVTFLMLQLEESMNTVSVESEKECASDKWNVGSKNATPLSVLFGGLIREVSSLHGTDDLSLLELASLKFVRGFY